MVSVSAPDVELASDLLWGLGVVAIEERIDPSRSDVIELWTSLGEDSSLLVDALHQLGERWSYRFEAIDPAISETWRAFATPIVVEPGLVVAPAWRADDELPPGENEHSTVLFIEPGATFGMGDHPTTKLTLRALRGLCANRPAGFTVLDVGCGSGILAVAAACFGAGRVIAIDISPAAVPTTRLNAELNGVADRVDVSTAGLADVEGSFDIVLANILAPALIELADELRRASHGGVLVISGLLAERFEHVVAALGPMTVVARQDDDGWTALTLAEH